MIHLTLDEESLNTVRLAFSPLWETVASIALLARYRGEVPSPYTRWARTVRRTMPPEVLRGLMAEMNRPTRRVFPQSFVHLPDARRATLGAELAHLREQGVDSAEALHCMELLEQYWEWALAPHWTAIRTCLEEEVLFRGRTLATVGPDAMLGELGGRVDWSGPTLTAPYRRDLQLSLQGQRLLLVPTVFTGGLRLFTTAHEGVVAMAYQARAVGFLQAPPAREPARERRDRLGLVLGLGRAQVLRSLEIPKTTTMVAGALGLAKSTVSQHLSVLADAGLIWRQRLGGQVFYQLDRGGFALLEHLGH
ncbi:DNA-binding transcriptional ArsR family regulator [Streptacidiphilus sp. MAP12-33]|uniref:ArsR/SmtB family transcription factor n=1 Tax=Streptacidiphilus sp. MAP12-33 TaxID=3156266 RepID=UPI003515E388